MRYACEGRDGTVIGPIQVKRITMISRFNPRLRRLILIGQFIHAWLLAITVSVKLVLIYWTNPWP